MSRQVYLALAFAVLATPKLSEADVMCKGPRSPVLRLRPACKPYERTLPISIEEDGTVRITGANLQIVSGSGATGGPVNGKGNLIIGYNEGRDRDEAIDWDITPDNVRTGSHNLVVGQWQNFTLYGGIIAGFGNQISGPYASVTGGKLNRVVGDSASVCGGRNNVASGENSSATGGAYNTSDGIATSIAGGVLNRASGVATSVTGGQQNAADGSRSSIAGGYFNQTDGFMTSVGGGTGNTASGGCFDVLPPGCTVAGGSIGGGSRNVASGDNSTVSGGANRSATGADDWVAGGRFQDN